MALLLNALAAPSSALGEHCTFSQADTVALLLAHGPHD